MSAANEETNPVQRLIIMLNRPDPKWLGHVTAIIAMPFVIAGWLLIQWQVWVVGILLLHAL